MIIKPLNKGKSTIKLISPYMFMIIYGEIMIKDGLFKDFKIDEVYALHNWPELPLGHFALNSGPMISNKNLKFWSVGWSGINFGG